MLAVSTHNTGIQTSFIPAAEQYLWRLWTTYCLSLSSWYKDGASSLASIFTVKTKLHIDRRIHKQARSSGVRWKRHCLQGLKNKSEKSALGTGSMLRVTTVPTLPTVPKDKILYEWEARVVVNTQA